MATFDSSIPLAVRPVQVEQPMNALLQFAQLQGAQQQNKLVELKLAESERAARQDAELRQALATPGTDPSTVLLRHGRIEDAAKWTKAQTDAAKGKAELIDARLKQSRAYLDSVQTPDDFLAWTKANHEDPVLGPELAARGITAEKSIASAQQAMQQPGGFQTLLQKSAMGLQQFHQHVLEQSKFAETQRHNQAGEQHQTATLGETQRHNRAGEDVSRGQLAVSQGNLGVAQQQLGISRGNQSIAAGNLDLARKRFDFDQNAPKGVVNAESGLVIDPRTGAAIPITQDGVPVGPRSDTKPLAGAAQKQITEVRDQAITMDRLAGSFKPEFASKGILGAGSDLSLRASGVLGKDQDAVQWWKDYRKNAELVERHAMFGAALSQGEQQSWRSADIDPGMDKKTIEKNLATRRKLTADMLERTRQDLIDAGHSPTRVSNIAGRGPGSAAPAAPALPTAAEIDAELKRRAGGNSRRGQ